MEKAAIIIGMYAIIFAIALVEVKFKLRRMKKKEGKEQKDCK